MSAITRRTMLALMPGAVAVAYGIESAAASAKPSWDEREFLRQWRQLTPQERQHIRALVLLALIAEGHTEYRAELVCFSDEELAEACLAYPVVFNQPLAFKIGDCGEA